MNMVIPHIGISASVEALKNKLTESWIVLTDKVDSIPSKLLPPEERRDRMPFAMIVTYVFLLMAKDVNFHSYDPAVEVISKVAQRMTKVPTDVDCDLGSSNEAAVSLIVRLLITNRLPSYLVSFASNEDGRTADRNMQYLLCIEELLKLAPYFKTIANDGNLEFTVKSFTSELFSMTQKKESKGMISNILKRD